MIKSQLANIRLGLVVATFVAMLLFRSNSAADSGERDATQLAERFAPQLMHPHDEPNLPTNVDWFLPKTTFTFHNARCPQDNTEFGTTSLDLLAKTTVISACGGHAFEAFGTRSANREETFMINDVAPIYRIGSPDPINWNTYFHAFPNTQNGLTIQYWSFYAFNTGKKIGPLEIGDHGGDWEMVEVVLDSQDNPISLHMTGHTTIEAVPWSSVEKTGTHPVVYTEKGGHEAHTTAQETPPFILHQTWSQGVAIFPNSGPTPVGKLVDLGSKLHPKEHFLLYSGLWGSLGATPISSGYWGPAFNETGMKSDSFLAAWCDGINHPDEAESGKHECFPDDPR